MVRLLVFVACWLGSLGSAIGFGWGGGSGICGRPGQVRPALLPPAVRLSLDWRPSGNAAPVLAVYPPAAPHTRSAVWPVVRAGPATPRSGVSVFLCFSRRVSRSVILYLDGVTRAPYCYVLSCHHEQCAARRCIRVACQVRDCDPAATDRPLRPGRQRTNQLTGGRPQMKPARHRPSTGQEERRPRTTSVHGPVHRSP